MHEQDVRELLAELLADLLAERLAERIKAATPAPDLDPALPQLVTLDQLAAMVHRAKASLRRFLKEMPPPKIQGKGGRTSMWDWAEVRPWLAEHFQMDWLPERYPYGRFSE